MLSLLLSACAAPSYRLPSISTPTGVPQDTPARDAQPRLLQEAHRAFGQERYRAAALLFHRFADTAPDSPRLAEARWWLGRAYEQMGDYRAAMEQYRTIAARIKTGQQDETSYEGQALRRLDDLRRVSAEQGRGRAIQLALRLRIDRLPPIPALPSWFDGLTQAGVTALVVDPEPVPMPGRTAFDMESVRAGVAEAHRHGLLYWVRLDLHRGMGRAVRPEWTGRRCQAMVEEGEDKAPFDITNPAYQASVEETVLMLSSAGIDGLVLAARSTPGFADECSSDSLQEFARLFGRDPASQVSSGAAVLPGENAHERPVQYWRWAGWKARSAVQWAVRLRKVLRAVRPTATLLTEIHSSTLASPLQGLEQFGEDLMELVTHTGGWIVVRDVETVDGPALDRLDRQIGARGRVWVERTLHAADVRPVVSAVQELMSGTDLDRWNVLIRIKSEGDLP